MPDSGEKTVTEYRVVDVKGGWAVMANAKQAGACAREWDREDVTCAPHRVQSRTVTTSEWKDVPDA